MKKSVAIVVHHCSETKSIDNDINFVPKQMIPGESNKLTTLRVETLMKGSFSSQNTSTKYRKQYFVMNI